MVCYDTLQKLDDVACDLRWIAMYIEDVETMREKMIEIAEYLEEMILREEEE